MPGSESKNKRTKPVIWSQNVKEDLEKVFDHITENFSIELAIKKTNQIILEIESLSVFPRKGSISSNYSGFRELIVHSNTVYYRDNELEILITSIR